MVWFGGWVGRGEEGGSNALLYVIQSSLTFPHNPPIHPSTHSLIPLLSLPLSLYIPYFSL